MRIQTHKELTRADLKAAVQSHGADAAHKRLLKSYYSGAHRILHKQPRANTDVNNRLVSNYPAYISNMNVGFFIGQPVSYKSAADITALTDIFKYNDEAAHNMELAEEASITGEAYEILYMDADAQIRFASVPSEEMIIITDATLEQNFKCAIRHYRLYEVTGAGYEEFIDVYDAAQVRHYDAQWRLLGSDNHWFGEVPVIEYANNKQHRGDFEDVLTLVDAYNLAQSLTMDDLEDFTDAFLVLKNMHILDSEQAQELRRRKILDVDEGGGAEWLIKNINDGYVENLKTRLQRDIHKFSAIPDMSDDNFAGNASGVAIKYKLIGLEQVRSRKEREFKKALQRRIELIGNVLKLKGQAAVDFRAVDIQFTANIPANVAEQADIVTKLDGVVSNKTLLGLLPFVSDPAEELAELEKQ